VVRRDDLYEGPFLSKYPDVIFKLRNDWGVGWGTNGPLYERSLSHKLFPGNHRQESAVFLLDQPDEQYIKVHNPKLTDVAPTILRLLEIHDSKLYQSFDGKNLLRFIKKERRAAQSYLQRAR
jgi:hypothetical protein